MFSAVTTRLLPDPGFLFSDCPARAILVHHFNVSIDIPADLAILCATYFGAHPPFTARATANFSAVYHFFSTPTKHCIGARTSFFVAGLLLGLTGLTCCWLSMRSFSAGGPLIFAFLPFTPKPKNPSLRPPPTSAVLSAAFFLPALDFADGNPILLISLFRCALFLRSRSLPDVPERPDIGNFRR